MFAIDFLGGCIIDNHTTSLAYVLIILFKQPFSCKKMKMKEYAPLSDNRNQYSKFQKFIKAKLVVFSNSLWISLRNIYYEYHPFIVLARFKLEINL